MKDDIHYKLPRGRVLILRSCSADLTSYGGFKWPVSGPVSAPDWKPTKECGNGLHGWKWAEGDFGLKNKSADARWLVVEVIAKKIIELEGKVKFPSGTVVFCGHWWDAFAFVRLHRSKKKLESSATGEFGHASATGYSGHASATGHFGHASATGNSGVAFAIGANATVQSGNNGAVVAGFFHPTDRRYRIVVGYVGENGILPEREYIVLNGALVLKGAN